MKASMLLAALALYLSTPLPTAAQSPNPAGVTVVLVPGAGGATPRDFLIRNQDAFAQYGLDTAVAVSAAEAASVATALHAQGRRVVLVGMSAGTPTVAEALALGAPAHKVVFVSGMLMPGYAQRSVVEALGGTARLPPTLVVHNRNDECRQTPPEAVPAFVRWSGGRARVRWIASAPGPGAPCRPMSAHGFFGNDSQAVAAIAGFARGR